MNNSNEFGKSAEPNYAITKSAFFAGMGKSCSMKVVPDMRPEMAPEPIIQ